MNVISQTSSEAWAAISENPKALIRAVILPGLIIIALEFAPDEFSISLVLTELLGAIIYVILAVQTHRHILLQDAQPIVPTRTIDIAHYLLWTLILMLMFGVLMAPSYWATGASVIPIFLGIIPLLYISSRISLILPNRAIGGRASLQEAWAWSNSNGWKLTGALLLPPILISFAISIATLMFNEPLRKLIMGISAFPVTVFMVALLSVAYRNLSNLKGQPNEP